MSSNKTPKGKATPKPSTNKNGQANTSQLPNNDGAEYVLMDKDLARGLTEKEVEIEHLKTTIVALNEKIELMNDLKKDVDVHKELFRNSEVQREELQIHITKTSITIREDTEEHNNYQTTIINEVESLQNEIQRLKQEQARREQDHLHKLEETNRHYKQKIDQMNDDHHNKLTTLTNEHHHKVERLQKENHDKLTQVTQECNNKLSQMSQEHQDKMEDAQRNYHNKLETANNEHKRKFDQLREESEQMRSQKDANIRQLEKEKEEQRESYERKINELNLTIKRQQQTILQLNSTIIELKEIITQKSDVEDQLKHAREQIAALDAQKMQMQKELETASDYILVLEDKVYKANKTSLELLRQLKDSEVEIETLKNYIIELKQRIAVYIPVKDDVIDKKLAEFINNYPERQKLKIMFMRESEGVYQFGTKRIAVRVDKDKINIRVGGGYLSIDEFLDQYTPVELEKLERKDPLKKFSEKLVIQKTIIGKEIRESSPVRGGSPMRGDSPTKSPGRK